MPVPSSRTDLSTTASSNSPPGTESVFPNLDNYLRAAFAFIRQNYDDIQTGNNNLTTRLPAGMIMLWSGSQASIPSGWALCDGSNGTPDLRNRFVAGAGSTYAVGASGGATSSATDSQGAHTHTGTTGSHVLTTAEMPSHNHTTGTIHVQSGNSGFNDYLVQSTGAPGGSTANTGGDQGHTHTISSDGGHTHSVSTLPPYYALCYVMKT